MRKTYYVSPDGDDSKSGRRPKRAWRTLEHSGERLPDDATLVLLGAYESLRVDNLSGLILEGNGHSLSGSEGKNCLTLSGCNGAEVRNLALRPTSSAHDGISLVRSGCFVLSCDFIGITGSGSKDGLQAAYSEVHVDSCHFYGAFGNADLIFSSPQQQETGGSKGTISNCSFYSNSPRAVHLHTSGTTALLHNNFGGKNAVRAVRVHQIEGSLVLADNLQTDPDTLGLSVGDGVDLAKMTAIGNLWENVYVGGTTYKSSIPGHMTPLHNLDGTITPATYHTNTGWDL